MATPEQQKAATRKLTHWIENESKIVTYRTISREVGCHVNVAKNLLLAHFEAHTDLAPTYLLTGPLLRTSTLTHTELTVSSPSKATQSLRDMGKGMVRIVDMDERSEGERNSDDGIDDDEEGEEGNDKGAEVGQGGIGGVAKDDGGNEWQGDEVERWGVVLTGQETLDEKKKLFEEATLSVHIYALAPAPVKDPAQYLVPNLELHSHANYFKPAVYGTITGEAFKPAPPEKKPMKTGALNWGTKVDAKDAKKDVKEGGKGKEAAKKADVKKEATKEVKKESSKEVKKEALQVDKKPVATSSSKPRTSQSKKRTITSDTEEDEPEERPAAPKSKPAVASSTSKSLKSEPTSSMARREDLAALEAMAGMDVDMSDDEPEEIPKPRAKVEMTQATGKRSASGRKIRRVKKTKREMDSKGYYLSKDYWSEESYSGESEPESQPKAKPAAASSKSQPVKPQNSTSSVGSGSGKAGTQGSGAGAKKTASKPAAGQSTLKSFFQKK
ncbi:hypothetical protein IAT38_007916 [Cryptococcus sp. DSM 104549]